MPQNTSVPEISLRETIPKEDAKQTYKKVLRKNGIDTEIKEVIIVDPESLKGEHMASTCQYVTIKFADGSEDLELFIKKLVKNPFADTMSDLGIFDKEALFFNELLPKAKQFCIEKTGTDDLINFFPKSYFGDKSLIVLENLILQNYFMLDKLERQDLEQAKMVLKNLAKFHGVFYAMINDMGVQNFHTKYPVAVREAFMNDTARSTFAPMFESNVGHVIRMLQISKLEGSEETIDWLKNQLGTIFDESSKVLLNDSDEPLLVLNHGDCWNNNMMFLKNRDTGELIHHLFVDLQVIRHASPNIDLGYFLFTSVRPQVRRRHLIDLLKFYFDTLQETVNTLGTSVTVTFDEFLENYKKKCKFGFWMELIFFSLIEAMKEVDLEKSGDDVAEMNEYVSSTIQKWFDDNPEKAKNSCKDVIESVKEYIKISKS